MKSSIRIAIVTVMLAAMSSTANADFSVFLSGTDGFREASATIVFDDAANLLTIRLSNSASTDAMIPTHILTGLYFDLPAGVVATPCAVGGAIIPDWSMNGTDNNWHFDQLPFPIDDYDPSNTNDMGGEWAYIDGLPASAPGGLAKGISSTGLGDIFGPGDLFGGPPLDPPDSPDGLNFGITSDGDDLTTGNGGGGGGSGPVTGNVPLIKHEMLFSFEVLQSFSWDPNQVVIFQYGTSLGEPTITVPAPGASLLGILGLSATGWIRRRFA